MLGFGQFCLCWYCGSDFHLTIKLPGIAGNDFRIEMICQIYSQSGFPNSCSADDGDKTFQKIVFTNLRNENHIYPSPRKSQMIFMAKSSNNFPLFFFELLNIIDKNFVTFVVEKTSAKLLESFSIIT